MFENTSIPKGITFTKALRFHYWKNSSKNISLVGPGTYNNHACFLRQVKAPCQVKIRPMTGIKRNNANEYMMIGNHIIYQPNYLNRSREPFQFKLNYSKLKVDPNASIPYY